jgi:hypothetical protein
MFGLEIKFQNEVPCVKFESLKVLFLSKGDSPNAVDGEEGCPKVWGANMFMGPSIGGKNERHRKITQADIAGTIKMRRDIVLHPNLV